MRPWITVRAELARAIEADPDGDHNALRRELLDARAAVGADRLVRDAPSLTAPQRETLRAALHNPIDDIPAGRGARWA